LIEAERESLRQRAQKLLTWLVGLLEEDRAYGDAIEQAQRLLRASRSTRRARVERAHAFSCASGERATALRLYQECTAVLTKELGIQPSAATRITYREILDLDSSRSMRLSLKTFVSDVVDGEAKIAQ
jgi:DNA-binding SARP family transcriptional activator